MMSDDGLMMKTKVTSKNDDGLHSKQITRAISSTMIVRMVKMMIRMTMKKMMITIMKII